MDIAEAYVTACYQKTCQKKKQQHMSKSYLVVGAVLVFSMFIILNESSRNRPLDTPSFAAPSHSAPDVQLVAPNTDGWISPEKMRQISYE